jgi:tetratricopeptide (TPR) repeat protein
MKNVAGLCLALSAAVAPIARAVTRPTALSNARAESVDELITKGRDLLRAKKIDDAQIAFDAAAALDQNSPKTRVWVARGWIAKGKFDDALQTADELRAALRGATANTADPDYLMGLAFHGQAKQSADKGGGQYTNSQFEDSVASLVRATSADAARYSDAWLPLAEAAWYAANLPVARDAAEHAIKIEPKDPAAQLVLGNVAFAQFKTAQDASDAPNADTYWSTALAAFRRAIELIGNPQDPAALAQLANAHVQCGFLHQWKQDMKNAAESYAIAASFDPSKVDFNQVHTGLGAEPFAACMSDAILRFEKQHGRNRPESSTLHWWNGFALFENAKNPEAETEFRRAVELWPAYINSWYYIFRCAYAQKNYPDAIEALRKNWELAPDALVAALGGQPDMNFSILEYLVGWCADPEKHAGVANNADAALLSEMLTRAAPTQARYWNNLGLFLRDEGDALRAAKTKADPAQLQKLWEAAYAAYSQTLELEPGNPNYLNDTAVMLHYYLKRDYDKALAMYEKAAKRAEEELARTDLSPEMRDVIKIAKRDSNNNIVKVKRVMEKLARGEKPGPEDADQ